MCRHGALCGLRCHRRTFHRPGRLPHRIVLFRGGLGLHVRGWSDTADTFLSALRAGHDAGNGRVHPVPYNAGRCPDRTAIPARFWIGMLNLAIVALDRFGGGDSDGDMVGAARLLRKPVSRGDILYQSAFWPPLSVFWYVLRPVSGFRAEFDHIASYPAAAK